MNTMRNEKESYNPGHSVNTGMGDGPDKEKTIFEQSKKENFGFSTNSRLSKS